MNLIYVRSGNRAPTRETARGDKPLLAPTPTTPIRHTKVATNKIQWLNSEIGRCRGLLYMTQQAANTPLFASATHHRDTSHVQGRSDYRFRRATRAEAAKLIILLV